MKRTTFLFTSLFNIAAMLCCAFCISFHFNTFGFATAIGAELGNSILPIAAIAYLVFALISLVSWLILLGGFQGKGRGLIFGNIILLLINICCIGYALFNIIM